MATTSESFEHASTPNPASPVELVLALFDATQPIHKLGLPERVVLEQAARFPVAQLRQAIKAPYRAVLKLARAQPGLEGEVEQQRLLAAVVALWQRRIKPKQLKGLKLSAASQRLALTLAAILRLAEGLDPTGAGGVTIQQVEPSERGMWIVLDAPSETLEVAAMRRYARWWQKLGYPEVEALRPQEAAARRLLFPPPVAQIGILPQDTLAEAGRKVMRYHFAQMLRHEEGTRLGEDIEALHDMRVATRRLRAAFEVFERAFDPLTLKPHLKGLRAVGRALGSVRDLDVFMEKAQRYLDRLPEGERGGLEPLLAQWKGQRDEARARMLEHLNSWAYDRFKCQFNLFLQSPDLGVRASPPDQPTPELVCQLAPVLIYTRAAAARAYAPWLADAPLERLHALRIEFKKLRYTVEYFSEVLGKRSLDLINNLKLLQDHLGDLNDAQVASQIIGGFIEDCKAQPATLPDQEQQPLSAVVEYLAQRQAEQQQLQATFQAAWKTHFNNHTFRRWLAQAVSVL